MKSRWINFSIRVVIIAALMVLPGIVNAVPEGHQYFKDTFGFQQLLALLIGALTVVLFLLVMVLSRVVKLLKREMLGEEAAAEEEQDFWSNILQLKPMAKEKDQMTDHEYDGIRELDNPAPPWFMYLFYGTIVFAVIYLLNYHVFENGKLQLEEYETELLEAEEQQKQRMALAAYSIDENSVERVDDEETMKAGKVVFVQNCMSCHREDGGGGTGPNLTDEYWIYGNTVNDIFKTVKYGVAGKMPEWQKKLSPLQMQQVANYVLSLQGTNPENPKDPQGEKMPIKQDVSEVIQ